MACGLGQGIIDSIPRLSASGRAVSDADRGLMREARVADDVHRHDRGEFAARVNIRRRSRRLRSV